MYLLRFLEDIEVPGVKYLLNLALVQKIIYPGSLREVRIRGDTFSNRWRPLLSVNIVGHRNHFHEYELTNSELERAFAVLQLITCLNYIREVQCYSVSILCIILW